MNDKLKLYIPIIDFLSEILGNKAEIVLHDLKKDLTGSIVYIKNSLSGRKIGSPATDFLRQVLDEKIYLTKNYLTNYSSKDLKGKKFKSSSFFIKEENELIGMLCVNIDQSEEFKMCHKLEEFLLEFSKCNSKFNVVKEESESYNEKLYGTKANIIEDALYKVTGCVDTATRKFKKDEKIEVVRRLDERGFFSLKDSIQELAQVFKMSEVSIYKYIQQIKKEKNNN